MQLKLGRKVAEQLRAFEFVYGPRLAREHAVTVEERREHSRRSTSVVVCVAASPEHRLPQAQTVDISRGGLLMAFDEPVGFPAGHRLVISLALPNGHFHALGRVARVDRGDDFRTYVALSFEDVRDEEFEDLSAQLDGLDEHHNATPDRPVD